jgi:hypothetical protein
LAVLYGFIASTLGWAGATLFLVSSGITLTFLAIAVVLIPVGLERLRETGIINDALAGKKPRNGEQCAVIGRIKTRGEPLTSPFSEESCAAYSFHIFELTGTGELKSRGTDRTRPNNRVETATYHYSGYHLAASEIQASDMPLKLLGFPEIYSGHGMSSTLKAQARLKRQTETLLESCQFEEIPPKGLKSALERLESLKTPEVTENWCLSSPKKELKDLYVSDQIVPDGSEVCVIGRYDSSQGGLLADNENGAPLRLFVGGGGEARKCRRGGRVILVLAGLIAIAGLAVESLQFASPTMLRSMGSVGEIVQALKGVDTKEE